MSVFYVAIINGQTDTRLLEAMSRDGCIDDGIASPADGGLWQQGLLNHTQFS